MRKHLLIVVFLFFGSSFLISQENTFGLEFGVMNAWNGNDHPVGISGTYYYSADSICTFTGSIGWYLYTSNARFSVFGDFGHSLIPISCAARFYLLNSSFKFYPGIETGLIFRTNNNPDKPYSEWSISERAGNRNHYFFVAPQIGCLFHIANRMDLDINLKYQIVSVNSCTVLNIGILFPI
jgi:hypothetical protein